MKISYKQRNYDLRRQLREKKKELRKKDNKIALLEKINRIDYLTGLFNRKGILEELENMMKMRRRKIISLPAVLFDIDYFKRVNEIEYVLGDKLLKFLSRLIRKNLRETDKIGRLGGDEFLILLPDTDEAGAIKLMEKLRKKVESHRFKFKEARLSITISGGVSEYQGDYKNTVEMLRRADQGLRKSKENGKNQFHVFTRY